MFGQSLLSGAFGSSILDPGLNFDTKLYTGNGSNLSIGGKINGAALFNGSSSKVILSGKPLNDHDSVSITFWARNIYSSDWATLFGEGPSGGAGGGYKIYKAIPSAAGQGYLFMARADDPSGYVFDTYNGTAANKGGIDFGVDGSTWVHCAFTVSPTELIMYKNGASIYTKSITNVSTTGGYYDFQFMFDGEYSRYVKGDLDQVRLFTTTLTPSQVADVYAETATTANTLDFPAGAGCVGAYTLDANAYNVSFDGTTDVATCNFPTGAGCIALYQFDDNVNDTCGTYTAQQSNITYTPGMFNKAAVFNGSSSAVEFPSMGTVFQNNYTLSAWFKLDAYGGSGSPGYNLATIVTTFTDYYGWVAVSTTSKKLRFYTEYLTQAPWGYAIESTSTIELGVWYHMVATKSSTSGMKLYINGVLENTEAAATQNLASMASTTTYVSAFGSYGSVSANMYSVLDGEIDQARIFNSVLTQSQVTELARGGQYNGTSTDVTYPGFLNFQPDLTWIKSRTYGYPNILGDSVRGVGNDKMLISDFTGAEGSTDNNYANAQAYGYISSLDTNGFSTKAGTTNSSYVSNAGDYVSWNWKAGADTYAGKFNGSNSTVNTTWTHSSTTFSASCWVKFSVPVTNTIITTTDDGGGAANDGFTIAANKCWLNQNDAYPQTVIITYTATVNDNKWHNIVLTNDGTTFKVYIDGSLDGSASSTGWTDYGTNPFVMGYQPRNPVNQWYTGELDQIRLFTTALTATQVTSLYNEAASDNTTLNFPAGAGCTAAYTLNETANDLSGNYNGTASNITYVKPGYTGRNNDGSIESQVSANQDAGFSIIKYIGVQPGSGNVSTIGHGLKNPPELIMTKVLNSSNGWPTLYYKGSDKFCVRLNQNNASDSNNLALMYGNGTNAVAPTSSVYTVGNSDETNYAYDYIAYAWHSVNKYSKIGTYVGNNASNPIDVGFEPAWVMAKGTDSSSWLIMDSTRGANDQLYANLPAAEYTDSGNSFSTTGFTMKSNGNWNASGVTYIYMAFAVPLTT